MKKRIISAVLAAVMAAFSFAGCGAQNSSAANGASTQDSSSDTKDSSKITFVLDWTPNTNHTGLYVAKNKGWFKDEGLDVEIVQPPEDGAEALVGSGKAQFGVSFQDSMLPALVGKDALPITAVAAVIQHNTSGIISRKGEGMDRPKGLEGKKYATWELPVELATIKQVVEKDGGDYDKVSLIPQTVTDEAAALQSKQVDAIWVFYGWAGIATNLKNVETDYFAFKDIDPVFDYYTPVIIGNNDWLKANPDTAKKFLSVLKKGYEFAISDPDGAADILCTEAPELDKELVKASQEYLSKEYKSNVAQWGWFDPERWNSFYAWIDKNDLIEDEIPMNFGFTNDYLS